MMMLPILMKMTIMMTMAMTMTMKMTMTMNLCMCRFAEAAAERHIPKCKDIKSNKKR